MLSRVSNHRFKSSPSSMLGKASAYSVFAIFSLLAIYPLVWLLLNAFKSESELFEKSWGLPKSYGWDNFGRAWESGISRYLLNSIVVTTVTVTLVVVVSLMAAYGMARFQFRGRTVVVFYVLGGLMMAPEVSLIPLFRIVSWLGIIDTPLALILPTAAFGLPFTTFLLYAYILGLPKELEEAARIDGAGSFRVFISIIVPLSKPIVSSAALLMALRVWNEIIFALTLVQSDSQKTLPIGLLAFVSTLRTEWTVVMAGLIISAAPMVLLFLLAQRSFVRGLTAGGVKG